MIHYRGILPGNNGRFVVRRRTAEDCNDNNNNNNAEKCYEKGTRLSAGRRSKSRRSTSNATRPDDVDDRLFCHSIARRNDPTRWKAQNKQKYTYDSHAMLWNRKYMFIIFCTRRNKRKKDLTNFRWSRPNVLYRLPKRNTSYGSYLASLIGLFFWLFVGSELKSFLTLFFFFYLSFNRNLRTHVGRLIIIRATAFLSEQFMTIINRTTFNMSMCTSYCNCCRIVCFDVFKTIFFFIFDV